MSRPHRFIRFKRKLGIESLESRQLFAVLNGSDDLTIATQAVASHHYTESYLGQPSYDGELTRETSRTLTEVLKPQIEDYWKDFFGNTPQQARDIDFRKSAVLDVIGHNWVQGSNFSSTAVTPEGFLYTVNGEGNLDVIDATNSNAPSKRRTIPGSDYQMSVLVDGNRLVTLQSTGVWLLNDQWSREYGLQTKINVYDITDRANPNLTSTSVVDGVRAAAQLKSDKLTLVVSNYPNIPSPALHTDSTGSQFESAIEYENRVGTKLLDALLPAITIQTANGATLASKKIGSSKDLVVTSGSIAYASTVIRLNISSDTKALTSETLIGITASNILFDHDDVYLASLASIIRVHSQADGELIAEASDQLTGSITSSKFMDISNGILRIVSYGSNETYVTTFGDSDAGWGKIGKLTLPNTYPYAASFSDGTALIELRGADDNWLQLIDMKDPASLRAMGRQTSHGLSQVVGIGSEKFIVSTYDAFRFQLSIYAVQPSGDLLELDRWQSFDGNGGGQNGVALGFAEGMLTVKYAVNDFAASWQDAMRAIRLFDLKSSLNTKLLNSTSYVASFVQTYRSDYGSEQPSSYPTVPLIKPVFDSASRKDVNADGFVTAMDVLIVINYVNNPPIAASGSANGTDRKNILDIDGDGDITALDILQLINAINLENQASQLPTMLDDIQKRKG